MGYKLLHGMNNIYSNLDRILLESVSSVGAASKALFQLQKKATVMDEEQFWQASEVVIETRIRCSTEFAKTIGYEGSMFGLMKDPSRAPELHNVLEDAFEKACIRRGTTKDIYNASHEAYATSPQGQRKLGRLTLDARRKILREEEEASNDETDARRRSSCNNSKDEVKEDMEKEAILESGKMYENAIDRCMEEFVGLTGEDLDGGVDVFAVLRDPTTGPYLQKSFHAAKKKLLEKRNVSMDVFQSLLQKYSTEPELKPVVVIEQVLRQESRAPSAVDAIELPENTR